MLQAGSSVIVFVLNSGVNILADCIIFKYNILVTRQAANAAALGNGEIMINAGISFALDKGKGFGTSKAAMVRKINSLTVENAEMKEKLAAQGSEIEMLKEALARLEAKVGITRHLLLDFEGQTRKRLENSGNPFITKDSGVFLFPFSRKVSDI